MEPAQVPKMTSNKSALLGVVIIATGLTGFFVSMPMLGMFGYKSDVMTVALASKLLVPFLFMTLSMYGVGYATNGNESGIKSAGSFAGIILVFFVIGTLRGLSK